jgi:hypothetical protein
VIIDLIGDDADGDGGDRRPRAAQQPVMVVLSVRSAR